MHPDIVVDLWSASELIQDLEQLTVRRQMICRDCRLEIRDGRLGKLADAAAVVVGTRQLDGWPAENWIRELRSSLPHVGLYVVAKTNQAISHWLPTLARLGVDEAFCLQSASDREQIDETLRQRSKVPAPELALRVLWDLWETNAQRSLAMHH